MDLENYRKLCSVCDRLLMAPNVSIARIANPWLHIVREHPHFLRRYEYLFSTDKRKGLNSNFVRLIRYLAKWACCLVRSSIFFASPNVELSRSARVLIVSHLVSQDHLSRRHDFYFDALPEYLRERGIDPVVLLIDHTGGNKESFGLVQSVEGITRLVVNTGYSLADLSQSFLAALEDAMTLFLVSRGMKDRLSQLVAARAAVEALSGGAMDAQLIARRIAGFVRNTRCAVVLTTFEGHAWERAVYFQIRTAVSRSIGCFAYQHAAVFRYQHGLKRSLGSCCDPDELFTSGEAGREELILQAGMPESRIHVLGSNRGLQNQPMSEELMHKEDRVCLILPEGLESECVLLISFAIRCARKLPSVVFLCRLHPATNLSELARRYNDLRTLPPNVVFSSESLTDDAKRASWVLYRGTTAVVAAVEYGAIPIYLACENELSIDPLYALGEERWIVNSPADLVGYLTSADASPEQARRRHQRTLNFCRRLYSPFKFQGVVECLRKYKCGGHY